MRKYSIGTSLRAQTLKGALLSAVILLPFFLCYIWYVTTHRTYSDLYVQREAIALILLILNIFVLSYHLIYKAHPKYYYKTLRKISIHAHILGGVIETVACIMAYYTESSAWVITAALAVLLLHAPSALYQTLEVYGSKAFMIPAYFMINVAHIYIAIRALIEPSNHLWVVDLYFILHIYVLCRVFYFILEKLELYPHSRYTTSILFSGLSIVPAVFGPTGSILTVVLLLSHIFIFSKINRLGSLELKNLSIENTLTQMGSKVIGPLIDPGYALKIISQHPSFTIDAPLSERDRAELFYQLETEKRGKSFIDKDHWLELTSHMNQSTVVRAYVFEQFSENTQMHFECFFEKAWRFGRYQRHHLSVREFEALPEEQKKEEVFNCFDMYSSGRVSHIELLLFFSVWGLYPKQVISILNDKGIYRYPEGINKEQFYQLFPNIMNYFLSKRSRFT